MNTHNICFRGEIRKDISIFRINKKKALSVAMKHAMCSLHIQYCTGVFINDLILLNNHQIGPKQTSHIYKLVGKFGVKPSAVSATWQP